MIEVLYANDPLCGWCFATSPLVGAAADLLEEEGTATFTVLCGGLVTGERVRPVSEDREYLRAGLAAVERASGRAAGAAYHRDVLEDGTWVSDSEPAVRAVEAVRHLAGERAARRAAHALGDALYLDGHPPDRTDTVDAVAAAVGLDAGARRAVVDRWSSPEGRAATAAFMEQSRARGARVYPSLLVAGGSGPVVLVEGYATTAAIVDAVRGASGGAARG